MDRVRLAFERLQLLQRFDARALKGGMQLLVAEPGHIVHQQDGLDLDVDRGVGEPLVEPLSDCRALVWTGGSHRVEKLVQGLFCRSGLPDCCARLV